MSLIDRLFRKVRQQERERLLAAARGDIKGCSGLDCEECERMTLLDHIAFAEEEALLKLLNDYCDNNHFLECECQQQLAFMQRR